MLSLRGKSQSIQDRNRRRRRKILKADLSTGREGKKTKGTNGKKDQVRNQARVRAEEIARPKMLKDREKGGEG